MSVEAQLRHLERLERVAARYRAAAIGLACILFATAQAPATSSRPLVVRDAAGMRAVLTGTGFSVEASGKVRMLAQIIEDSPQVSLVDSLGHGRETLIVLNSGASFVLFDQRLKARAEMSVSGDEQLPRLTIRDPAGTVRAAAFIGSEGRPELSLYGSDGKSRAYLATDDAVPFLVMKDGSDTTRVAIGAYSSGTVGLDIRNASNQALFSAP